MIAATLQCIKCDKPFPFQLREDVDMWDGQVMCPHCKWIWSLMLEGDKGFSGKDLKPPTSGFFITGKSKL